MQAHIKQAEQLELAEWLRINYSRDHLAKVPDTTVFALYKKQHKNNWTKTRFSTYMASLGLKRVSRRFDGRVGKVYKSVTS